MYESGNWRTVEATVTAVRVDMKSWRSRGMTTVGWVASVQFKYSVGGMEYASFADVSQSTDVRVAARGASRFPVGSRHTILYDPDLPSMIDLHIPSRWELRLVPVEAAAGLIMFVAGLVLYGIGNVKAPPRAWIDYGRGRGH